MLMGSVYRLSGLQVDVETDYLMYGFKPGEGSLEYYEGALILKEAEYRKDIELCNLQLHRIHVARSMSKSLDMCLKKSYNIVLGFTAGNLEDFESEYPGIDFESLAKAEFIYKESKSKVCEFRLVP